MIWIAGAAVLALGMRLVEIWICGNAAGLHVLSAAIAYRYPFTLDHWAALGNGVVFFVLPSALAAVLGARLTGGVWKRAF